MSSVQNVYQIKSRYVSIDTHGKKIIYGEKKAIVFQFKVGYMIHPMLEKHKTHK